MTMNEQIVVHVYRKNDEVHCYPHKHTGPWARRYGTYLGTRFLTAEEPTANYFNITLDPSTSLGVLAVERTARKALAAGERVDAESRLVGPFSRAEVQEMMSLRNTNSDGSEQQSLASVIVGLVRNEIARQPFRRGGALYETTRPKEKH